jgi:hypothetical protein
MYFYHLVTRYILRKSAEDDSLIMAKNISRIM